MIPLDEREISSLVVRNLRRGVAWGLPCGRTVAQFMAPRVPAGIDRKEALNDDELWPDDLAVGVPTRRRKPPLWYYILRESELREGGGQRLGFLGSWIVAEVIIGLLEADPESYLNARCSGWTPARDLNWLDRGRQDPEDFKMIDLLRIASE
jgi:hypothetical protein